MYIIWVCLKMYWKIKHAYKCIHSQCQTKIVSLPFYTVLHQQSNLFPWSVLISRFHSARCYGCQSLQENQQNLKHSAYPCHKTCLPESSLIFGWGEEEGVGVWGESGKEVDFLCSCSLICVLLKKKKKKQLCDSFRNSTLSFASDTSV